MKRVRFTIPAMWADHHVIPVVRALENVHGVKNIAASAARWEVVVEFDPSATSIEAIESPLKAIGYPPSDHREL